jgi:hypothetical protein
MKKKMFYLQKNGVGDHFVKLERELLAMIYENKENVIKIKDRNVQTKANEGDKKKNAFLDQPDPHLTVTQNRVIDQQFHSKSTEKFAESENRMISSMKKSDIAMIR